MWGQAVFGLGGVLLLAGLNSALAEKIYFKDGGSVTLELRPPSSGPITNILWKFRGDLVAEWIDKKIPLSYYGSFDGRSTLDTTTARLEIRNMGKADAGLYTVEINSKVLDQRFDAEEIDEVPEPEITPQPLICSGDLDRCSLVCNGLVGKAGPVTYSWKQGDGEWKESGQILDITKSETEDVKTFSCRMKNPVSEKDSKPKDNPFLRQSQPGSSGNGGLIAGVIGVFALVAAVGGIGFWKREYIISKFCQRTGNANNTNNANNANNGNNPAEPLSDPSPNKTAENHDNANNPAQPLSDLSPNKTETEPLNPGKQEP